MSVRTSLDALAIAGLGLVGGATAAAGVLAAAAPPAAAVLTATVAPPAASTVAPPAATVAPPAVPHPLRHPAPAGRGHARGYHWRRLAITGHSDPALRGMTPAACLLARPA